jgi:purine-binding chemotaxis protein CheW
MPDDVVGIYNLRGSIIPIVDLRRRLGLSGEPRGPQQILVCRVRDSVVGFIVDEVLNVTKIPRAEIKAPPASVAAQAPEHIVGIAAHGDALLTIIDIAAGYAPEAGTSDTQEG